MADKRITDLQLISALADGVNLPVDDTSQTYRATMLQFYNYIRAFGFPDVYSASKTYAATDYAFYSGDFYKSVSASNLANTPSSSPTKWKKLFNEHSIDTRSNYSLTATVAASALTITLKTDNGNTPTDGEPVKIGFRNATLETGDYSIVTVKAATSIVVPSSATLGHGNAKTEKIYVYLLNNAGTGELLVTSTPLNEDAQHSTTAIVAGSTSISGKYSTTLRSNVAVKFLGTLTIANATAGTWATGPTEISLQPLRKMPTAMSDSEATALGLKVYAHGTAYNNSVQPTITRFSGNGTLSSVTASALMPYQTQDGSWRLKFNISVVLSSTSRAAFAIAIAGVTFKNTASHFQSIIAGGGGPTNYLSYAYVEPGTGNMGLEHATATLTGYRFSGDVELESKPTWAY